MAAQRCVFRNRWERFQVARWIEYQTGVPYIEEILDPPFKLDDEGMLRVPTGPGLGVKLNWDAVGRYTR